MPTCSGPTILTVLIGLILSSAFSAIVVFAQELVPGRVGMIAGMFFGFAFGIGGIGAAVLGVVADIKGIDYVFQICSLPAAARAADGVPAEHEGSAPRLSDRLSLRPRFRWLKAVPDQGIAEDLAIDRTRSVPLPERSVP